MSWFDTNGKDTDVVLSSRIRFARNIKDYPFSPMLDETGACEIIEKVKNSLPGFRFIDLKAENALNKHSLVEKHFISREAEAQTSPSALLIDDTSSSAVMVCEEDHIRIQTIYPGLALDKAYEDACKIDDGIDANVNYAYSDTLGYLTHCPTNLGTGMRASVMLFLPALTSTNLLSSYISSLEKIGLTMRGTYGEGSESKAYIYQISNSVTLGITEEETLSKLSDVITKIIDSERKTRERLLKANPDTMRDKILRSLGILKWAYMLSSDELLKHWSNIKLGANLGIIKDLDDKKLSAILVNTMPATLMLENEKEELDEQSRDKLRAEIAKKELAGAKI